MRRMQAHVRRELIRMRRHRLKRRIFSYFEGRYLDELEIARYALGYRFRVAPVRNISLFSLEENYDSLFLFFLPLFLTIAL